MEKIKNKKINFIPLVAIVALLLSMTASMHYASADTASTSANVTNSSPVASGADLNNAAAIILTEDTTTSVSGTVTVTDNNGCEDISGVSAVMYRTNVAGGSSCVGDNNDCYTGITCTSNADCTAGGSDLTETYTCSIDMQFYADATDSGAPQAATQWTFEVTPSDGDGAGIADTDTEEVSSLTALNVTAAIDYGTLALGADTGATNQTAIVTNTGNRSIDSQMSGTAMTCTIGSIPVGNQEYAASTFTYGTGTALSGTPTSLVMALPQPTNDADPTVTADSFWGLGMPTSGVSGSCTGTNTFTAIND